MRAPTPSITGAFPQRCVVHTSCCPPPCPICSVLPILLLRRAHLTNVLWGPEDGSLLLHGASAMWDRCRSVHMHCWCWKEGQAVARSAMIVLRTTRGSVSDLVDLQHWAKMEQSRCHWYSGPHSYSCRTSGAALQGKCLSTRTKKIVSPYINWSILFQLLFSFYLIIYFFRFTQCIFRN